MAADQAAGRSLRGWEQAVCRAWAPLGTEIRSGRGDRRTRAGVDARAVQLARPRTPAHAVQWRADAPNVRQHRGRVKIWAPVFPITKGKPVRELLHLRRRSTGGTTHSGQYACLDGHCRRHGVATVERGVRARRPVAGARNRAPTARGEVGAPGMLYCMNFEMVASPVHLGWGWA